MTDNEIVKALECCSMDNIKNCEDCPYYEKETDTYCANDLIKDTFDLINRQKAEIEKLKAEIERLEFSNEHWNDWEVKCRAIKEFAERLKEKSEHFWEEKENFVSEEDIDNIVKEMTEVQE